MSTVAEEAERQNTAATNFTKNLVHSVHLAKIGIDGEYFVPARRKARKGAKDPEHSGNLAVRVIPPLMKRVVLMSEAAPGCDYVKRRLEVREVGP